MLVGIELIVIKGISRVDVECIGRYSKFHGQLLVSATLLVVAIVLRFILKLRCPIDVSLTTDIKY